MCVFRGILGKLDDLGSRLSVIGEGLDSVVSCLSSVDVVLSEGIEEVGGVEVAPPVEGSPPE